MRYGLFPRFYHGPALYAFLGDQPETVKWLTRSADRHEWQALNLAVHPAYAKMRKTPEFVALERRMGLVPYTPQQ